MARFRVAAVGRKKARVRNRRSNGHCYHSRPDRFRRGPHKVIGTRVRLAGAYLGLLIAENVFAGDAVAVGYNSEGVWTAVTYYSSSSPKGGRDYKTEKEASEIALRDVRKRSEHEIASAKIIASSDSTGFVAVARGKDKSGKDVNV